jgi:predicted glycoside hydrolase/deacetylase ChbG (UPF0249 family)
LPRLIVTADDYGYSARYNEGILRAAAGGGIDAASAMVLRGACAPAPILESGVEVGLHIELPPGVDSDDEAAAEPRRQLGLFINIFRRPPAYLDGHHHCHAGKAMAAEVESIALELGIRVRCAGDAHRDRLRAMGIETPERLIGRWAEDQPVAPAEIERVAEGKDPPSGLTEWMTHPGLSDPDAGSSFDRGREDDLAVALRFAPSPFLRRWRDRR